MGRSFDINVRYRFPDIGELNKRVLFRKHKNEPVEDGGLSDAYTSFAQAYKILEMASKQ